MNNLLKNLAAVHKAESAYSSIMDQIIKLEEVYITKGLYTGLRTSSQQQLLEILRAEAKSLKIDLDNAMREIEICELDNLRNYESASPVEGEAPHTSEERNRADYVVKTTINSMLESYDRTLELWA